MLASVIRFFRDRSPGAALLGAGIALANLFLTIPLSISLPFASGHAAGGYETSSASVSRAALQSVLLDAPERWMPAPLPQGFALESQTTQSQSARLNVPAHAEAPPPLERVYRTSNAADETTVLLRASLAPGAGEVDGAYAFFFERPGRQPVLLQLTVARFGERLGLQCSLQGAYQKDRSALALDDAAAMRRTCRAACERLIGLARGRTNGR